MAEYRPIPDEDLGAFRDVLDYAFRPEAGPAPDRDEEDPDPGGDRRGLYEDGRLVTTGVHRSFTVAVRGRWLDATDLSGVATRPEDRRRGLVRELLAASLVEYRDRDQPFSLLWPFKHAFYRQFGWGRLGSFGRYRLAPDALAGAADHPLAGGRYAPLGPDDWRALRALDDRFADRHDLAVRRTETWYRHRFFEGWQEDPFVYGWYRDDELRGYLRYHVDRDEDGDRTLTVWEFGAPDDAAAVNLLRFLHRHEAQMDRLDLHARPGDLVFDLVEDPRDVELEVQPGPMGRLVDVTAGLEALPAPDGVGGTLALSVADPLADWNDGEIAVEIDDDTIAVEPDGGDGPAASLPVHTLSRLALGTTTVERARLAGGLEADAAAADRLTALFPPRETFLREFF